MLHFALLALLPSLSAQILPTTYDHPVFGQPKSQILSYAHQSFQALVAQTTDQGALGKAGTWTAQNGWAAVALWDRLRGTRDFSDVLHRAQEALAKNPGGGHEVWNVDLVNYYNDDSGWAGLSNVAAYETYGDALYLQRAKGVYDFLSTHGYVAQATVDRGYLKGTKNADNKIQRACNGNSMVGGVYWVNGGNPPSDSLNAAANTGVNAVSTGLYALLGAELCRITKDTSYCDRTLTSLVWLDNHLVSPSGLIWDGITGDACKVTEWTFTYNTGLYIAAYAELAHLTGNSTALAQAERTAKAALATSAPWNSPSGVINEGAGDQAGIDDGITFKSNMIRFLHKSMDWFGDEDLKSAVRYYINIQYYGITQLASDNGSKPVRYGRNWLGPYVLSTDHSQLAVLDVLNALALNPDSAFPAQGSGPVMSLS